MHENEQKNCCKPVCRWSTTSIRQFCISNLLECLEINKKHVTNRFAVLNCLFSEPITVTLNPIPPLNRRKMVKIQQFLKIQFLGTFWSWAQCEPVSRNICIPLFFVFPPIQIFRNICIPPKQGIPMFWYIFIAGNANISKY